MSQSEVKKDLVDGLDYIIVRGQVLYFPKYVTQLEQQLKEANEVIAELPDRIRAALDRYDQEMEGYSYYGSNPGVSRDDYKDVVTEAMTEARAYQEKWSKSNE